MKKISLGLTQSVRCAFARRISHAVSDFLSIFHAHGPTLICRKTLAGLDAFSARIVHELKTAELRRGSRCKIQRSAIGFAFKYLARLYAEKGRVPLPALFSLSPLSLPPPLFSYRSSNFDTKNIRR